MRPEIATPDLLLDGVGSRLEHGAALATWLLLHPYRGIQFPDLTHTRARLEEAISMAPGRMQRSSVSPPPPLRLGPGEPEGGGVMRHDRTPHAGEGFRTRRPRRLHPLQRGRVWGGLGAGCATLPSDRTPERHHLITRTQRSAHAATTSTFLGERLMSTAHGNTVRRLKQQEEAAQAALAAQRAKVRAAQAKLRHAAQQERLAHQRVMGRLAEEAGLATLDLDTLRQAFTVLGQLAQSTGALTQWLAQWGVCDPEPPLMEPAPASAAQGTANGTATPGREKECPAPSFSGEKR